MTVTNSAPAANQAQIGERLERLVVAATALMTEMALEGVLERVVEVAAAVIGARYAAIGVLAPGWPATGELHHPRHHRGGAGIDRTAAPGPWDPGSGDPGGTPDPATRPRAPPRLLRLSAPSSSDALVPRRPDRGEAGIFGNLYLTEKLGGEAFTEEDEHIAVLLAANTAAAVENARLHEESARLLEEVQQLHRARERFFAMVNHELRNALAAVHGWAEMHGAEEGSGHGAQGRLRGARFGTAGRRP